MTKAFLRSYVTRRPVEFHERAAGVERLRGPSATRFFVLDMVISCTERPVGILGVGEVPNVASSSSDWRHGRWRCRASAPTPRQRRARRRWEHGGELVDALAEALAHRRLVDDTNLRRRRRGPRRRGCRGRSRGGGPGGHGGAGGGTWEGLAAVLCVLSHRAVLVAGGWAAPVRVAPAPMFVRVAAGQGGAENDPK